MDPVELDFGRHNAGIDPGLEIWEWQIPLYLFLGGMVAGLMVFSAVYELGGKRPASTALRSAPLAAMVLLSLGMGALFLDLGHKLYVWRFYLAFRPTSPMSWGAWILLAVYPALVLQGLGGATEGARSWLKARFGGAVEPVVAFADRVRRPVLWATATLGVGLGVYTGLLLGLTPARLLWNSAVLGPLFLVSGLSTGAALLLLLPLDETERHAASRFDMGAIVVELVLLGLFLVGLATGGTPQRYAADALLGGEWTAPFWALVVATGLFAPLVLDVTELRLHRAFTRVAPLLVLVGGLSLRVILVAAGQDLSFAQLP